MKIALIILLALPLTLFAQSKKELKDAGALSRTENTSKMVKKSMVNFTESVEKYDDNGNKIELIEYKSNGDIKTFEQYEYNSKGKVTRETQIDPVSKKPKTTIEYTYDDKDKLVKEVYYDKKNVISKTVEYTYDNSTNLKLEKKTMDANGKVVETKTYTYETKK